MRWELLAGMQMQEISALMSRHMSWNWTPLITGSLYLHLVMSHKPGRIDGNADDFVYGGAGTEFIWASLNGGTSLMDLLHLRCFMAAASFRWEDEGHRMQTSRQINDPQEAALPSELDLLLIESCKKTRGSNVVSNVVLSLCLCCGCRLLTWRRSQSSTGTKKTLRSSLMWSLTWEPEFVNCQLNW